MRNLKKFLALVMAMVMAFSLMLTASAKDVVKDWTDKSQVTEEFTEAVDVLSGMDVFQGDPGGTFRPGDNITRAEVAALIYRLATGDTGNDRKDLFTTTHPFTDVNADDWFAGYVGFCWNAGYIKGTTATTFNPYGNVTGYETLAMVLRAMGYDANNEFTGTNWIVNVSATAQQRGLLADVKTTHYANTLHLASRRDVVASILFQAAQKDRVKYTPAFGYQSGDYNRVPGVADGRYDDYTPLGVLNFGLRNRFGIVVDNQETSLDRKYTSLSTATNGSAGYDNYDRNADYSYSRTGSINNFVIRFDMPTGLGEYGHAYKVWFDERNMLSDNSKFETTTTHKVYAAYDKVVKDELVWSNTANGNKVNTNAAADNDLGAIAKAMEFKVPATKGADGSGNTFWTSDAFDAFSGDDTRGTGGTATAAPQKLYKLISNSSNSNLDAVISLNTEATKVTAVNNNVTSTDKTVTIARYISALSDRVAFTPGTPNTIMKVMGTGTTTTPSTVEIFQKKLTANSTTTLKDYVVANAIGGCDTPDTKITAYNLHKQAETKTGTVNEYHVNATWSNTDPDYVVLSDGTKIEKSPLYMAVADGNYGPKTTTIIPQVGAGVPANETYGNGTYEFLLDDEGRYIGAWPIASVGFIYGTYMDYTQETSSSAFSYFMTGIDENGKQVTLPITDVNVDDNNNATWNEATEGMRKLNSVNRPAIPFRGTLDATGSMNGIGPGRYKAFAINGTKFSNHPDDLKVFDGLKVMNNIGTGYSLGAVVSIGKNDKTLGNKNLGLWDDTNDTNVDGGGTATNLYFTENTKFVLVSGIGTDSAKAEVYNGITELMGDAKQVNIYLRDVDTEATTSRDLKYMTTGAKMSEMTYYSTSPFIYAQTVGVTANQVDVIYMPKAAVEFVGKSNLYYVGNNTPTLFNAYGEDATQFTMYDDQGNEAKMWIEGDSRVTTTNGTFTGTVPATSAHIIANTYTGASGNAYDKFYELVPTDNKTISGETIYRIGETTGGNTYIAHANSWASHYPDKSTITKANTAAAAGTYAATTRDAQVATIYTDAAGTQFNVGSAKVVNLAGTGSAATLGTRYPGIASLGDLNDAASVNTLVKVSAVVSDDNNMIVTTIFVAYDQN